MYSDWGAQARSDIAAEMAKLPDDASWQDRRKALRAFAREFHGGTSWGKKVWARECRAYLEKMGMPPRPPHGIMRAGQPVSKQGQRLLDPDIIFPYRGEQ